MVQKWRQLKFKQLHMSLIFIIKKIKIEKKIKTKNF